MENIFKDLAQTINLLKRQHGDKLAYTIASQIVMQKEIIEKIKRAHPYTISQVGNKWRTRVYCADSKEHRKQIYGNTEEEVCIKLIEWYGLTEDQTITLNILYVKWIQHREKTVGSPNTLLRNKQHYKKYFEGSEFWETRLCDLNKIELEEYCTEVIVKNKLTRKEWNNAKSIMNGMFELAMKHSMLLYDPFDGIKIPDGKFRQPKKPKKESQIFFQDEVDDLLEWCEEQFEESEDVRYLFPSLNFYVGMRIGELVALTWSDWNDRFLTIEKEEVRNQSTGECKVVSHTKTFYDRTVVLPREAVKALERIRLYKDPNVEWIFHKDGERLTERQMVYALEKYSRHRKKEYKSTHKIRKTFGSNLYAQYGFTPKQCADYLGNNEKTFINHYNFDNSPLEEMLYKLDNPK